MSLQPRPIPPIPDETARVAHAVVATGTTAERSVRLLEAYEIAMPPLDQFTDKGAVWLVVAANGCVSMARWDSGDAGRN